MIAQATHVVREHALLTAGGAVTGKSEPSLDRAWISESAFNWLLALNQRVRSSGSELLQQDGHRSLKLDNYVGYLETPCGTQIEILPKHHDSGDSVASTRRLLQRMILNAMDLPSRTTDAANLQVSNSPLPEWLAAQFLRELDTLVRRGVRFQYQRVEEERRFLRGQLDVAQAIRQRPDRRHLFPIRHDIHTASRPENRLLRSCLDHIVRHTRDSGNWRRASELRELFASPTMTRPPRTDFFKSALDRATRAATPVLAPDFAVSKPRS
jgi:5-methylcytosine-specific restriction enzyme subunit McrC